MTAERGRFLHATRGISRDPLARHLHRDEHIAEVVTILAQKTLSNYFNHIYDTPLDVPVAAEA